MTGAGAEIFGAWVGPSDDRTAGARTLLADLERSSREGSETFLTGTLEWAGAVAAAGVWFWFRPLRRKRSWESGGPSEVGGAFEEGSFATGPKNSLRLDSWEGCFFDIVEEVVEFTGKLT